MTELPKANPNQRTMRVAEAFLKAHPEGFTYDELAEVMQGLCNEAVAERLEVIKRTRMAT